MGNVVLAGMLIALIAYMVLPGAFWLMLRNRIDWLGDEEPAGPDLEYLPTIEQRFRDGGAL